MVAIKNEMFKNSGIFPKRPQITVADESKRDPENIFIYKGK